MAAIEDGTQREDQRQRAAFRAAQLSHTNVYWFRRLKWHAPRRLVSGLLPMPSRGGFRPDIVKLLVIGIFGSLAGYVAVSLHLNGIL